MNASPKKLRSVSDPKIARRSTGTSMRIARSRFAGGIVARIATMTAAITSDVTLTPIFFAAL